MTDPSFTITVYDGTVPPKALGEAVALYREVYAEPPYLEGEEDVASFAEDLPRRAKQESFRFVLARRGMEALGFAIGHRLPLATSWWQGAVTPLPEGIDEEFSGRTFAIIEIAVRSTHRRSGLGGRLHTHLVAGLEERRTTLLVRPDVVAARAAYARWGYSKIGAIRPFPNSPTYLSMILDLGETHLVGRHKRAEVDIGPGEQ